MAEYEGKENLDVMTLAINYNNTIYDWITSENLANKNILDFGAGKGEFANRFDKNIFAVELDESMHSFIKAPTRKSLLEFEKEFDFIYSSNVLEHIKEDEEIIKEFFSFLKPNSKIKILVPAHMLLYSNMDKAVGHYRRYSKKELEQKFKNAGFTIEYCKYFDFLGFFATLVFKSISNSSEVSPKSLIIYDKYIFPISRFFDKITFGKITGKNLLLKAKKSNNL